MSKRQSRPSSKTTASAVPKTPQDTTISERSQSEFPVPTDAMSKISLDSDSTSGARSQTAPRRANPRRTVYSVVPDSAVLTPLRRPSGYGKAGRPIQVYTNHFKVSIDDAIINQYDIEIKMMRRDGKTADARKNERGEVLKELTRREKNFPLVWYDEGASLYTRELLTDFTKALHVILNIENESKTFVFKVLNLVRQEKIRDIFDFINGKTAVRPRDPIRVIETLFKQTLRHDFVCVRNKFFSRQQKPIDLGDGRGMASGFHQALCLTPSGPTLNINLAFTCFYLPLDFVEFSCRYLRKDITRNITEVEISGMRRLFRNLAIETTHTGRTIRYRVRDFGQSANQLTFNIRPDENQAEASLDKKITVTDYFAQKYKPLKYPHLPCIDARSGNQEQAHWLPMECVKVVEWERALRPLDSVQRALVSKTTIVKPDSRYRDIMNTVRERNFPADVYLKALNIKVDANEMMQITARVLPPPRIQYRDRGNHEVAENVAVGKWSIRNRFNTSPVIHQWGIMYFGPKPNGGIVEVLKEFEHELPSVSSQFGIVFKSKPVTMAKPDRKEEIEAAMKTAANQGWQLAVVVLNDVLPEAYECVKQWGNQRLGLITQCVSFQALERNSGKLRMYIQNLSQKMNAKIGGINGVVNLKEALSQRSDADLFMFFGADVTHTTCSPDLPSVAAVVGSCDPTCSRYAARLCEQFPTKQGRYSIEIIKQLDEMVIHLLQVFARTCGNRLPNRIIFYRDGVDDGQFQKVLDNEVKKLKDACRAIYGNNSLPRITFIVVKKRHNTRFFAYDGQYTTNIEAGTVIDQTITHPSQFDFYLCSQAAGMGTSRPALYHVLHDENGFSSDDIQQLTYWLCHTDVRCSKSVSIPAPVHYASLAAHASRSYEFDSMAASNHEDDHDDADDPEKQLTLEDIKTKVMVLNEKIRDNMWFV